MNGLMDVGNKNKANSRGGQNASGTLSIGVNPGQGNCKNCENGSKQGTSVTAMSKNNSSHRSHSDNKHGNADGMQNYNAKTGFMKVRFMTGNSKGI
jgi:hypothetical protein